MDKAYGAWVEKCLKALEDKQAEKVAYLRQQVPCQADRTWVDRKSTCHLSASVVTFVEGKLLMVFHPYQQEWLLPAGHVDPGEWPEEAALRELTEETGRVVSQPEDLLKLSSSDFWAASAMTLIDVNWIPIKANPLKAEGPHHHLDCRYLVREATHLISSAELTWRAVPDEEVPEEFRPYLRYRVLDQEWREGAIEETSGCKQDRRD